MNIFKSKLIQGTILLTISGIIARIIGFIYKIYLADALGAENLGIYQLIFPIYGVCFTIYGAGVQTAISQMIAATKDAKESTGRPSHRKILISGMAISLSAAIILTLLVFFNSDFIAEKFIMESSCSLYLKILSLLFPFCSISACICGYYYGTSNTKVPAAAQIIEQLSRVIFVFAICSFFGGDKEFNCRVAVAGMTFGEIAGCIFNVYRLIFSDGGVRKNNTKKGSNPVLGKLFALAATLTFTKLIISILHSVEAVFIPSALQKYGYSSSDALSMYGIFSGMALPFILFPSTFANSFAVMLLPYVAHSQSNGDDTKIRRAVTLTTKYSLLIGWLFTCIFIIFGRKIGLLIFDNETAGIYIQILSWLCPFLYLTTAFTSIINGLGKTKTTFAITAISLMVKLYSLFFVVPASGIKAYLIATLISQIVMTFMEVWVLKKYIVPDSTYWICLPTLFLIIIGAVTIKLLETIYIIVDIHYHLIVLASGCIFIALAYIILLYISRCISKEDFKI